MKRAKCLSASLLSLVLVFSLSITAFATEQKVSEFDDVNSSHWAYSAIMIMVDKGAIQGTKAPVNGVGHFEPEGKVSLGQFLAIATRLVASDKIETGTYDNWAIPYYNTAIQTGIISESDFSVNELNNNISRQDMAYILVGLARVNGETLTITPNIENNIKDYNSIPQGRQTVVKQAYSNGLITGKTDGNFDYNGNATRGEIATVFCRVMNYVTRPTTTVATTPNSDGDYIMGGYVSNDKETKGMMIPQYSREYDLKALDNIQMGEDSKGVYVTFTAPNLPSEVGDNFHFNLYTMVYTKDYDAFTKTIRADVKSGETVKLYFEDFSGNPITASQIGSAKVSVSVQNSSNRQMFSHSVESTNKGTSVESWYDGRTKTVDYNSSNIFKGINK